MSQKSHCRIPDYSGNMVSKFHNDWIKIQGEIASYKNVPRIIGLKFRCKINMGGGPRVVVSTAAFHARVRGSVPGLGGLKETKMFLPHPRVKVSIVGSLRDREVACSASDRQGSNFESCVWRTVSSQSSHHPQEVLLAQFSLYVHKGGLKPDSFFICKINIFRHSPNIMTLSYNNGIQISFRCGVGRARYISVTEDSTVVN